ncbi:AMP-binding protein [Nocardia neocaledoniensis]|uniref:AMP-binding protein n=1 Tax=Nocardia neocaledoniensis TaxID=236511 RepID=UPI002455837A|nr:AMP-binding protein [Nocardia neocaledoniensis]
MSTLVTADNVIQLPRRQAGAPIADGHLADTDLDRWANRLARLLLTRGAAIGDRIALAIDADVEAIVAAAAVRKIGATPATVADGASAAQDARFGITTADRRPDLSDEVDWLVLDDRWTLQRYLVSSDAPLSITDLRAAS